MNFKECHPRCVGELDRWEGSQKNVNLLRQNTVQAHGKQEI